MPNRLPVQSSPRRPEVSWWLTEDGGEHLGAAIDFLSRLVRGQQPEWTMPIGMIADLMTGIGDGVDALGVLLSLLADDEKRGTRPKLRENVEDTRREQRVGTVVKRQRDGMPVRGTTAHRPLAGSGQ
jgi:hypothetical protein